MSLGDAKEVCPTGLYTRRGECCKACNLGEGVAQPCGANQTVCEPCLDSEYRVSGGGKESGMEGGWRACPVEAFQVLCALAGTPAHSRLGARSGSDPA